MNILAIDTATEACSAALLIGGECRQQFQTMPRGHTQALLPMVHALLADAQLVLSDLDGLAVGRGPGAFTGVRIGVSAAQGLALGLGVPVIGVSNLAAMAWLAGPGPVASVIDARAGGVYAGYFDVQGDVASALMPECVVAPQQLPPWPEPPATTVRTAGTGWDAAGAALASAIDVAVEHSDVRLPTAEAIARLAATGLAAGQGTVAAGLQPVYLRDQVVHQSKTT